MTVAAISSRIGFWRRSNVLRVSVLIIGVMLTCPASGWAEHGRASGEDLPPADAPVKAQVSLAPSQTSRKPEDVATKPVSTTNETGPRRPPARPEDRDFGVGPFAFLAYLLWQVYRWMPFSGTWYGETLFVVLAVTVFQVSFWPFLWKAVRRDITTLATGRVVGPAQHVLVIGILFLGLIFFLVYFGPDGFLFGDGRLVEVPRLAPGSRRLVLASLLVVHLTAVCLLAAPIYFLCFKMRSIPLSEAWPFRSRNLVSLYSGGGVFVSKRLWRNAEAEQLLSTLFGTTLCFFTGWPFVFLLLFARSLLWVNRKAKGERDTAWFWPLPASFYFYLFSVGIVILAVIGLAVPPPPNGRGIMEMRVPFVIIVLPWFLAEGARMTFVYIQHKQVFGRVI